MARTRACAAAALLALAAVLPATTARVSQGASPTGGGTAVDAIAADPGRLMPNASASAVALQVERTIFTPLFYTDSAGKLQPGLAATIPTFQNGGISRDGLTYTFHLRPGLQWSDGQPLDARDVDFSWKTWLDDAFPAYSTAGFDQIKSTSVSTDSLSITFHLSAPYAPFISAWTDQVFPLPRHILAGLPVAQIASGPFAFQPSIGSGPFVIATRKPTDNIVEVRNPYYYQAGKPHLDRLIFKVMTDPTAIDAALQIGTIDSAWSLDADHTDLSHTISGYTWITGTAPAVEEGLLNVQHPALADVRVRQALEFGLDRAAMVHDVWHNQAPLLGSDQPPAVFSFDPAVQPYPFEPSTAARLLGEAGWTLGADGYRHKNGHLLSLNWSTTGDLWRVRGAAIAQQNYEALGIDLRIILYPPATFFNQVLPGGNYDIAEFSNGFAYDPDPTILSAFGSDQAPPRGLNWGHYANPAYDRLIRSEESTPNPAQRKATFAQMQEAMNRDLPALWLYAPPILSIHRDTLHSYRPAPFSGETWNAQDWWKGQ
jgi:peptide/nickel transport system substrate-binding protein